MDLTHLSCAKLQVPHTLPLSIEGCQKERIETHSPKMSYMHVSDSTIEITHNGAGETAQWLRPRAALAEDPSANTVTQTTPVTPVPGAPAIF